MGDTWYELSAQRVNSIYFRAPVFLRTTGKAYSLEEQLKRSQWSAFIRNLIVLDKALWINYPPSVYQTENKLYQLKIATSFASTIIMLTKAFLQAISLWSTLTAKISVIS